MIMNSKKYFFKAYLVRQLVFLINIVVGTYYFLKKKVALYCFKKFN